MKNWTIGGKCMKINLRGERARGTKGDGREWDRKAGIEMTVRRSLRPERARGNALQVAPTSSEPNHNHNRTRTRTR